MISVDEALRLVLEEVREFGVEQIPILGSVGRIIAIDVTADRDFPPYDRVTMDGFAIKAETFNNGQKNFKIESIQAAGTAPTTLLNVDGCIEVMTGAVLPINTDAVIPYEHCKINNGYATIDRETIAPFQNIHSTGIDTKSGEVLVKKNEKITPATVAILATVGMAEVAVLKLPRVAVCSTGDELVDIEQIPEPHQIRSSNNYLLTATLLKEGIDVTLDHLADVEELMTSQIKRLISTDDVLIFSGAVSKGKFDLLPEVLGELGMETIFHGVAQRPGKPFLFGKFSNGPVVFAFPGNPVSTFVCYHKYFVPWLRQSLKQNKKPLIAALSEAVEFKPDLSLHQLVQLSSEGGILKATAITSSTSGDMVKILKADGMITLPAGRDRFDKNETFEVQLF